ncbi:beta-lactamase family protein [Mucilaginibacter sp. HMF5004]|uniref:serine hydrolase domain-containing protein n=1 Tax=Mucilaginibacter rivuli TaxID=2857527 RepID=UPI001C5ED156|nr:serine hydrolase domain-containing protein [Mucilaginibacter rivuli]MBW4889817.1 beta-lactamase family protein [Mucilaginibacter rivuli]
MKVKVFITLAVLVVCCQKLNAQNFTKVDAWLDKNTAIMGGRSYFMVYKDGHVVHEHAVNQMTQMQKMVSNMIAGRQGKTANLGDYKNDTRQMIASCSKWLSAALVMTFVDEGKLKLTDTVGKYLPVLSKSGKGKISLSQCLSHLTGIKEPPLMENLADMKNFNNMDDAMAKLATEPMEGEPGKVFHYSNAGLQIAGAVIEKISGKSFETLFAERIAKPLGMINTDFGKGKVALPAGGAISTPADYLNFLTMILNRGMYNGKRILSESSIAQMQVNRVDAGVKVAYSPTEAGNFGYGFGEWVMNDSSAANPNGAVTSPGLFGSFPWVDNKNKYAAFMMTFYLKSDGRNERYRELKRLVDEALK